MDAKTGGSLISGYLFDSSTIYYFFSFSVFDTVVWCVRNERGPELGDWGSEVSGCLGWEKAGE